MDIKQRMQAVIAAEAAAIQAINVTEDFVKTVEVMQTCSGKILTTGIGKAGHIAKKFAATLCSTATPADFVHPAEAAHGDLGIVGDDDVLADHQRRSLHQDITRGLDLIGVQADPGRARLLEGVRLEHPPKRHRVGRAPARGPGSEIFRALTCRRIPAAKMCWMTESWRSRAMRSRSS